MQHSIPASFLCNLTRKICWHIHHILCAGVALKHIYLHFDLHAVAEELACRPYPRLLSPPSAATAVHRNLSIRIPLSSSAFTSPSGNLALARKPCSLLALQVLSVFHPSARCFFVFRQFWVIEILSLRMHCIFPDELLHRCRKPVQVDILFLDFPCR